MQSIPLQCEMQDDDERLNASFYTIFTDVMLYHISSDDGVRSVGGTFGEIAIDRQVASFGGTVVYLMLCVYVVSGDGYQQSDIERERSLRLFLEGRDHKKKVVAIGILCATLPFGVRVLCWGIVLL